MMEIYPRTQAEMLFAALSLGLGAGLFRRLLLALRTVVGAYLPPLHMRALYERVLPLLGRPVGFPRRRARGAWCFAAAFATDIFFCLTCTLALLFLLYDYNDGAWRISAVLLFLLGFALFRAGTRRVFARANAYLAYGLSVLLCYVRALLCLPVRGVALFITRLLLRPAVRGMKIVHHGYRKRVSDRLCRAQLALAAQGLIVKERNLLYVKKEDHPFAMDHPHSDRTAVLRGADRGLHSPARMERAGKAKRGAGKAKSGN